MKRFLGFAAILLLVPALLEAQEPKLKRVLIFPFKVSDRSLSETYGRELSGLLSAELARDGDVELLPGAAFAAAAQEKKIDPARMARIANRVDCEWVLWGTVTKLDEGLVLDVSAIGRNEQEKPRLFTASGKDRDDLSERLKDLALEIGTVLLKRPTIDEIKIEGNRRIQKDVILTKLGFRVGRAFNKAAVAREIRELYSMGYFDDVQIRAVETPKGGVEVQVVLKERPSIKTIEVTGNKKYSTNEILDAITTKSLNVASVDKIRDDIGKLKKKYEKDGYYQPKIDFEIQETSRDEAKLIFKVDEGQKSYLKEIVLEGQQKLPESDARALMTIKPKGWLWFLDESGTFTSDKLEENRMRVVQQYLENGFVHAQVGQPRVDIQGDSVKVTYPIQEGERYQVRKTNIEGDLIGSKEELIEELSLKPKTWFKRSLWAEDIKNLTKKYNNLGYAYADVEPKQQVNDEHNFLDLTYKVTKGDRVSIERVDIVGNERTRDKVIRRSIAISEGDLYNGDRLDATKKMLEGMEFFEAVRLKTSPGSKPDLMNLTVEVLEKKTGSLAAGLGYSSQDGAMGNINLKEMNLFGLGVVANAKANLSGRRNSYEGSIAYPWLFDIPLTGSVRGYKAISKEDRYLRDGEGFSVNFGYPLIWGWQANAGFSRDSSKLSGFDRAFAQSVANYYRRMGSSASRFMNLSENAVSLSVGLDTRNNTVIPTAGSKIQLGTRISGLGGDVSYSRWFTEALYYHSLPLFTVIKLRGSASLLGEVGTEPIPFDRRILLGGISSIRGYNYGEIGPRDQFGNTIGGDRSLFANLEYLFPLPLQDKLKMSGVAFVDAGNAWNASHSPFMNEIKGGAGIGIRWMSPMGPIRLEYGWKIKREAGEEPGAFAFAMGQLF
jgi:outer membrane protein insertion porin family